MRGNVVDMAGRQSSSQRVRQDRDLAGERHHHAPIGLLLGGIDFNSFVITIKKATADCPAVAIRYGTFINIIVDFIIVAFVLFGIIKLMNTLKTKKEAAPAAPPKPPAQEVLLAEIRDILKKGR